MSYILCGENLSISEVTAFNAYFVSEKVDENIEILFFYVLCSKIFKIQHQDSLLHFTTHKTRIKIQKAIA